MNQTIERELPQQVMHRARLLPEMLNCLKSSENLAGSMDLTVLERQRARLKWQEQKSQQSQQCSFDNPPLSQNHLPSFDQNIFPARGSPEGSVLQEMLNRTVSRVKDDPGMENGWPDFGTSSFVSAGYELPVRETDSSNLGYAVSKTSSCPVNLPTDGEERMRASSFSEKITTPTSPVLPKESAKKRKAERAQQRNEFSSIPKIVAVDEMKEKRIKADTEARRDEEDSKGTEQNNNSNNYQRESSGETAKENSKVSEVQKPDYIHVRARRGQATDSHSLAERVRREKISERMKYLQDLVPGCNKITGKAGMLDEIINYVQSLQKQVEFLSMKLAAVNPRLDFNIDNFFAKEMFPGCNNSFPAAGLSPEHATTSYLQFNPMQPVSSMLCGIDVPLNSPEIAALRRTTSLPVSISDQFIDTSFHAHGSSSTWDPELQSLYSMEFHQGRSSFPAPAFPGGNLEISNLKMEM